MATDELSGLRIREAVRGLVVDQNDHVLLAHLAFPARSVWVLPGGGLEADETHHQGLLRELREEVGLSPDDIGPHLWTRTHIIPFIDGKWDGQRERAYLVRTPRFEPAPLLSPEQLRAEYLVDLRWWSIDDIVAADHLTFAPGDLGALLDDLHRNGPPAAPLDVGV